MINRLALINIEILSKRNEVKKWQEKSKSLLTDLDVSAVS